MVGLRSYPITAVRTKKTRFHVHLHDLTLESCAVTERNATHQVSCTWNRARNWATVFWSALGSVSCHWTSETAENTSGSDLFDFSGPDDELASALLPPPLVLPCWMRYTHVTLMTNAVPMGTVETRRVAARCNNYPLNPTLARPQPDFAPQGSAIRLWKVAAVVEMITMRGVQRNWGKKTVFETTVWKGWKEWKNPKGAENIPRCMPNILRAYTYVGGVVLFTSTLHFCRCLCV